jgi:alpha-tubulin suppressor-like RCC1 family protein
LVAAVAIISVFVAVRSRTGASSSTSTTSSIPGVSKVGGDETLYETGNGVETSWTKITSASGFTAIDEENQWGMAIIDRYVLAVGRNQMGQLGDGSFTDSLTNGVEVMGLSDVVAVDGGRDFGLAVFQNGTVYAWGSNQQGDLGNGSGLSSPTPRRIPGLQGVVQVSAGNNHSLALLSNGTVMAWGDNLYGDLGLGSTRLHERPVPVPGLSDVVAVSAGCDWSLALLSNGVVMAWGLNADGQLGNGTTSPSYVPIVVSGLPPIRHISAGGNYADDGHALAVDQKGKVWAWGDNAQGQLGDPSAGSKVLTPIEVQGLSNITSASAGGVHSLAVDATSGTLWVWGAGKEGQLGTGFKERANQPEVSALKDVRVAWAGALGSLAVVGNT